MSDITVRKMRFRFEEPIDFDRSDQELAIVLGALGLSMTMPYLEPYLIRTMKVAQKEITDPALAEDTRRFSQQEGHHFRNHADLNVQVRNHFEAPVAEQLGAIENALEADYQRFTRGKSLRFNLAYAEGFEAMTCASALAMAEHGTFAQMPGGEIFSWHMAEEIEHRTVAFGVYEHLVGSYFYRILVGTWSQFHYLRYVGRFSRCMAAALGRKLVNPRLPMQRTALRRWLHTWSPRYDPAKIDVPEGVEELLERYTREAQAGSA